MCDNAASNTYKFQYGTYTSAAGLYGGYK